jgi:hypothetical protein
MNPQDTKDAKKPAPSLPTIDQVPEELRGLKRWCCWKAVWDVQGKRWTKIPHSPITGEQIGAKPRGTKDQRWEFHWTDFAKARAGAQKHKLDGVGFVFVEGDGYTGVDFDNCRDPQTGAFRPVAKAWIEHLATYAEVSPSGTGAHAIARATLPGKGNKQPLPDDVIVKVEMYDWGRFFTYTGQRLENHPLEIKSLQPEINALHNHVFGDLGPEPSAEAQGAVREFITDDRIVQRIGQYKKWKSIFDREKKASEFVAEHYKGDDSSADLAFCTLIARYTASPAQVQRLWERSILWRDKSAQRADYRQSTIDKAFATARQSQSSLVNTSDLAELSWLWLNRFPRGKLIMLDGDPGLSKSMFSLGIAVSVMTGKPFLDGSKPAVTGGVILLSAEDDLRDTINPRLVAAGAPQGVIPLIHVGATKPDGTQFSLADSSDRLELEIMVSRVDAKLVIIDPLNAYLGDKVDSHNDQKIRQVLGPLSEIANRTGATVLCLRHLSKSGGTKAIYRGMGSIGYTAAARANFFVAQHPEEPEAFVFAASKFNLGPRPESLQYKLAFATVQGISKPVPYVSSGQPCALTADDLAAAQNQEDDGESKLGSAKQFIQVMLNDGPVPVKKIEEDARRQGIKPMTLRRAFTDLKVESYPDPDTKGKKKYMWRLRNVEAKLPF